MRATSSNSTALRVASARGTFSWARIASSSWLPTVKSGLSEVIGSWKTIDRSTPRISRAVEGERWVMSTTRPSRLRSRIVPESVRTWCSSPMTRRMVTVLPDPDSPTIANVSPRRTPKETPCRTELNPP